MVWRDALDKVSIFQNLNGESIKLILKGSYSLSNRKHLTMLNCNCKIIAKVLARRLKDKMRH